MQPIQITISKPLYDSMIYIRDKYLKLSKKTGRPLKITVPEMGSVIVSYRQWMKDSKKMEKEFLIPGKPMTLYGNYLEKFKTENENAEILDQPLSSLQNPDFNQRIQEARKKFNI